MDSNKIYAKVGRKVITHLGLEGQRRQFADGSYMVWFRDIRAIDRDWLAHPEETMAAIGGVLLSHAEAYEEQQGTVCRPLPAATDPRFVEDSPAGDGETDAEVETEAETGPEAETEAGTEPEEETGTNDTVFADGAADGAETGEGDGDSAGTTPGEPEEGGES